MLQISVVGQASPHPRTREEKLRQIEDGSVADSVADARLH